MEITVLFHLGISVISNPQVLTLADFCFFGGACMDKNISALAEEIAKEFSERFCTVVDGETHTFKEYLYLYTAAAQALIRNLKNNAPHK